MFQLRHQRETAFHSQPSVITTWQIGVGGGPHLTTAHSARQDMCEVTLHLKTYHPNSRVDFFGLFWYHATEVGNYRRGLFAQTGHKCRRQCQLLQWETVKR